MNRRLPGARFLADWKNWATLLAAVLVVLLVFVVVDSAIDRREARRATIESARASQASLAESEQARQSADKELAALRKRIDDLITEVQRANEAQGRAAAQVEALVRQVEQLGGRPVVVQEVGPSTTSTTIAPSPPTITTTTTPGATPQPTTTTAPSRATPQETSTTTRAPSTTTTRPKSTTTTTRGRQ